MEEQLKKKLAYMEELVALIRERYDLLEELMGGQLAPTYMMLRYLNNAITEMEFVAYALRGQIALAREKLEQQLGPLDSREGSASSHHNDFDISIS